MEELVKGIGTKTEFLKMASPNKELEEYWNEFHTIKEVDGTQSDDDELSKTPDEGEVEAAWLDRAGYGYVVNKFQDGKDLSDGELDTLTHSLTRAQAEAVRKRINVVSTTMRRRNRVNKVHVRDIFPTQDVLEHEDRLTDMPDTPTLNHPAAHRQSRTGSIGGSIVGALHSGHKKGYSMSGGNSEVTEDAEIGIETLGIHPRPANDRPANDNSPRPANDNSQNDQFSNLPSVSDIEISLDFHLEETEKPSSPISPSLPDPHRVDLPAFEPKPDPLGVTLIGDLVDYDMDKIKSLSHIELTALFDHYNIVYSRPKRKKKTKENGIFGVPLDLLVEQDQKRIPCSNVPPVFTAMINFLEKEGLCTEGILRVSGADIRAKQLRQDLEEKFYKGLFNWGDAGPHDVAVVLKQFLRELPVPLLSYDYLDAFPQVSSIPKTLEQLKALNLLILLLPDEHRDTLKALLRFLRNIISHSDRNKMGLNNVAMIMAPNLFLATPLGKGEKADLESELKKAAETSNIVKMLIHYQDVLWTIPTTFIAQVRHQHATDAHRKSKEKLRLPWRKEKDRSEVYKKPTPSPDQVAISALIIIPAVPSGNGNLSPEVQDGVIRVQAPHLTKSSALIQLDQATTAADVVAKFKGSDDVLNKDDGNLCPLEESNGHIIRQSSRNFGQYADTDHLYEVGGNISERCLDPRTKMMDLYHVNPQADWVIKNRKSR